MFVSANYFETIGLPLARGAGFEPTGDNPLTAEPVVIVGYGRWQTGMGADPNIIGRTLTLDGIPHVVVGVAPEHFSGHMGYQEKQLFLPLGRYAPLRADSTVRFDRGNEWLNVHGRLASGVGIGQASAAVAAVTERLAKEYPATNQLKAGIVVPYDPLGHFNEFRIVQTLAFILTGAVLTVVCLNVSGMMMVRIAMRERELAIRHAIGASRGRLARYLMSEAVVLAGLGSVLASVVLFNAPRLFAWWTARPVPFEIRKPQHTLTIVGITRDFPTSQMGTERAQLLVPLAQHPSSRVFLIARSKAGTQPINVTAALEHSVRELGPDVDRTITYGNGAAYPRIVTGVWLREGSTRDFLVRSAATGGAGSVILALAALGIYGVVGLMVAARTREIAVRAALGASRREVMGLIRFDVVKLVMPGVIFGLLIAAAIVRLNGDNLGLKLTKAEPLAYLVGAAIAVLVAILASLAHARRAASIQPTAAMRSI
jgi:hypothetical protein